MKLFCHILWLINMITCVHRLQSFVSWFVQRIDCKKAFLKNTWGIIFDPVQRLFKINCHVTSNRPKRHFWSTFKLFDLDQFRTNWNHLITNSSKFRFWSSSNDLKVDQKRNFEQIETPFISKSNLSGSKAKLVACVTSCDSHDYLLYILYWIKSYTPKFVDQNRNYLEKRLLVQFMENAIIESFFIDLNFSRHQTW